MGEEAAKSIDGKRVPPPKIMSEEKRIKLQVTPNYMRFLAKGIGVIETPQLLQQRKDSIKETNPYERSRLLDEYCSGVSDLANRERQKKKRESLPVDMYREEEDEKVDELAVRFELAAHLVRAAICLECESFNRYAAEVGELASILGSARRNRYIFSDEDETIIQMQADAHSLVPVVND